MLINMLIGDNFSVGVACRNSSVKFSSKIEVK